MKICIFCYNLHGAGPRNRAKNLVYGLGKYTDYEIKLLSRDRVNFVWDNIYCYILNCRTFVSRDLRKILSDSDVVHVPVNFYQALFVRNLYAGPIVLGAGIQHGHVYRKLTKYLINPSYVVETHPDVSKLWKIDGFNSTYIYPSVDTDIFKPYSELERERIKVSLNIPLNKRIVLYVGKLNEFKGADIFYKAIKIASNIRRDLFFVVIGDGRLRHLFRNNKNNLLYMGYVDNDSLPMYYNIADVTVVPSLSESFSFVSLESIACGTPVVTTAEGTIKKIFGKKQIYIWSDRNAPSLIEKVCTLLDDQKLYKKQIKKAFKFINLEGLTLDKFIEKHINVYKKVINK